MKARIDEIAKRYRDIVAKGRADGKNVAADNLQHFLNGKGGRPHPRRDAAPRVRRRYRRGGQEPGRVRNLAQRGSQQDVTRRQEDLPRSLGPHAHRRQDHGTVLRERTSTLTSTGAFDLSMIENEVTISGRVQHKWHDPDDWHEGLSAYIPGYGNISDEAHPEVPGRQGLHDGVGVDAIAERPHQGGQDLEHEAVHVVGPVALGRFVAVHAIADELVRVDDADPDFARRLRQVLDCYEVPWEDEHGATIVPVDLLADLDKCWNYTTKANDQRWLLTHKPHSG
jgi:hypothetical protein